MVVSTDRLVPLLGDAGDVAEPIRGTFISPAHSGFFCSQSGIWEYPILVPLPFPSPGGKDGES